MTGEQLTLDSCVHGPAALVQPIPEPDGEDAAAFVARLAALVPDDLRAWAREDVRRVLADSSEALSWYVVTLNSRISFDRDGVHIAAARVALADLETEGCVELVRVHADEGTNLGMRWQLVRS